MWQWQSCLYSRQQLMRKLCNTYSHALRSAPCDKPSNRRRAPALQNTREQRQQYHILGVEHGDKSGGPHLRLRAEGMPPERGEAVE